MSSRKPTVLDVAKVANVGASTVSRCLRGGPYVSEEVRQRIMDAVHQLGYEPNEVARSLRGGRTKSIGVIFPQIANPYFSRCVQEIELEATRQGSSVILLTHQEDPERQSRQLAVLRRSRADGVILVVAPDSDMDKLRHELGGMPVVALDRPLWEGADVVMLRHVDAAKLATQHLLEHGIEEIACVTANPSVFSFQERMQGYEQAMQAAGRKATVIATADYGALQTAVRKRLIRRPRLGALFALSSMATVSAIKAIREVQAEHPREIALIGFDDVDLASLVQPPISVVVQPTDLMARESVRLLFRRISADAPLAVQRIELYAELVRRNSCGCL
jgi:LacI family transcriptional regulator